MNEKTSDAFNRLVREMGSALERTPWFFAVCPRDAGMLSAGNISTEDQKTMLKTLLRSFETDLPTEIINEPVPGLQSMRPELPGFTVVAVDRFEVGDTMTITRDPVTGVMRAHRVYDTGVQLC